MHYKNGREAKAGDIVVDLDNKLMGVLHSPTAETDCCNGRLAPLSQNDPYVSLKNCLHIDDISAMAVVAPDVSNRRLPNDQ